MSNQIAGLIVLIAGLYATVGVAFAIAFVARGVSRVDQAAHHAPWSFRLVILPGAAALWPLMFARWRNAEREHS